MFVSSSELGGKIVYSRVDESLLVDTVDVADGLLQFLPKGFLALVGNTGADGLNINIEKLGSPNIYVRVIQGKSSDYFQLIFHAAFINDGIKKTDLCIELPRSSFNNQIERAIVPFIENQCILKKLYSVCSVIVEKSKDMLKSKQHMVLSCGNALRYLTSYLHAHFAKNIKLANHTSEKLRHELSREYASPAVEKDIFDNILNVSDLLENDEDMILFDEMVDEVMNKYLESFIEHTPAPYFP